jgi:hypothetical protein
VSTRRHSFVFTQHIALCERVEAACSVCTQGVLDIEDGVAGRPSLCLDEEEANEYVASPLKKVNNISHVGVVRRTKIMGYHTSKCYLNWVFRLST